MTAAERVLAHFERISEAPDAVPRLRRFVLDLAVRGKLAEQDPNDEPASALLKRISLEKTRLERAGEVRQQSTPQSVDPAVLPFDLRAGWQAATVAQVLFELQTGPFGSALHQSDYRVGGVPVVNPASIQNHRIVPIASMAIDGTTLERLAAFKLKSGDIVMGRRGEMGRCAVVTEREDGWLCGTGSLILRLPNCVYARFLVLLIGSPYVRNYLVGSAVGATMQNLNQGILLNLVIGLPPLAEQHRIVAKVDELMALCDRLEAAQKEREIRRDRLVSASLARLSQPADASSLREHACFHLQHARHLTTSRAHVSQLRQAILNLAVRGKLVPQNPGDEPLSALDPNLPDNAQPHFQIPATWRWARLHTIGKLKGGGTPSKTRDDFWRGSIPWVSPKDMKVDYLTKAQLSISEAAIAGSAVSLINPNSIVFVVRGMILAHSFPVAVTRVPLTINQDMKAIVLKRPEMAEFLLRALKGLKPEMLKRVQRSSHGTGRIEGSDYADFMVPLPPLAEQRRIVAKVDELMAVCDGLEAQIEAADTERGRLLESVLHTALAPAI